MDEENMNLGLSSFAGLLEPEDEHNLLLRNAANFSTNGTASYPRTLHVPTTPL
jgi:hypothetical protein